MSIDLARFREQRNDIIEAFNANPEAFTQSAYETNFWGYTVASPYFPIDQGICRLVTDPATVTGYRLRPLGEQGKVGEIMLVQPIDPSRSDQIRATFVLKKAPVKPFMSYLERPITSRRVLEDFTSRLQSCGMPTTFRPSTDQPLNYLGVDEFTNETLIAYLLEYLYETYGPLKGLNTYLKHYYDFICGGYGYSLMELADLGTLQTVGRNRAWEPYLEEVRVPSPVSDVFYAGPAIQPRILWEILKQMVMTLDVLATTVQFNSNDLKAANVFVSSQPLRTSYEGLVIDSPLTCKIGDYGKSSLTVTLTGAEGGAYRIFNRDWLSDKYLWASPFRPKIELVDGIPVYSVSNTTVAQLYTRVRHMGYPFYPSFDLYTFLVSILMDPIFFHTFFYDDDLIERVWNTIWLPEERNLVYERIVRAIRDGLDGSYGNTVVLLQNVRMKCRGTQDLLAALRYHA